MKWSSLNYLKSSWGVRTNVSVAGWTTAELTRRPRAVSVSQSAERHGPGSSSVSCSTRVNISLPTLARHFGRHLKPVTVKYTSIWYWGCMVDLKWQPRIPVTANKCGAREVIKVFISDFLGSFYTESFINILVPFINSFQFTIWLFILIGVLMDRQTDI